MIGRMEMPPDFKYRDAFWKGKPTHDRFDAFAIRHPRMDASKRAKIFAPFAALKGFEDEVASKDVRYLPQTELSPEDSAALNRRLEILHHLTRNSRRARESNVTVSVFYFVPCADPHHEACGRFGLYNTVTGICRRVDPDAARTIQVGSTRIPFDAILKIEIFPRAG